MSTSTQTRSNLPPELDGLPNRAVDLAAELLAASRRRENSIDRDRSALMARIMEDELGKKFTIAMADEVLRIKKPDRSARRMNALVEKLGVPRYFEYFDRIGLRVGNFFASRAPRLIMPLVKDKVRTDSSHVIISAEKVAFAKYLQQRREQDFRVNFNQLGEAVLGDLEAEKRLNQYLERLEKPGIDYCSVKLSSVVSQISLTGYRYTLEQVKEKLRVIYRAAIRGGKKAQQAKFVNLDMEEYRDLHLTVDCFTTVLDEPEFENLTAGIVLQAYLPDSYQVLQSLTNWARERHARSGGGIKVRLVKGANLAMEQVEASLHDWPQAPYQNKNDVDANFKRMLEFASRFEHQQFLKIGVASHNLFDVAFALLLRESRAAENQIEFEMLEGMANAQAIEVQQRSGGMIVYTPVCYRHDFESAIAYLVRRLDENTAPGSFLGALFGLREGSNQWLAQRDAFLAASERAFDLELSDSPNRTQNRLEEEVAADAFSGDFQNVPDTDFSLPANRKWVEQIVSSWKDRVIDVIPLQVGTQYMRGERVKATGRDPSRPGHDAYQFVLGTSDDVEAALQIATTAYQNWNEIGWQSRAEIIAQVARRFAVDRAESVGVMMLDAGKAAAEADVEISEAIDFANYYSRSLEADGWSDGVAASGKGVVVVAPPWNFPYAIPAGGVIAALMAGNSVILKPAGESVLTAYHLAEQFWQAGVPKDVLQFLALEDGPVGKQLIADDRVAAVILTGSYLTAQLFQSWRPQMNLLAETSGKNSMIISDAADVDLAIKDLVKGAFGHAGQKCSATSLALVHKHVYDDHRFLAQLKDAAKSLRVGGSWDTAAVVTPIIREPDETLHRGLTVLEPGEQWLLEPAMVDENPCLWSPGIRLGVKPGSWYHTNECFGPVLGLIRVQDFEEAIRIQNSNSFGLTGGLHSLDPDEIQIWRESVQVGNAYINRSTTGAIVRRQPFGGWKNSCVGPGAKAGGPNYVSAFCNWREINMPKLSEKYSTDVAKVIASAKNILKNETTIDRIEAAASNYSYWFEHEFSKEHDPSNIHGESNCFRYRTRSWHILRIHNDGDEAVAAVALTAIACLTTNCPFELSVARDDLKLKEFLADIKPLVLSSKVETDFELAERLSFLDGGSLRVIGNYDPSTYSPQKIGNLVRCCPEFFANGRLELLNFLLEQSISQTIHRYGNINA